MKDFFTENIGLKLLSLVLAFGLWAMIRAGQQIERNFHVPVELVGLPEDMVVVGDVDSSIALRIRGTRTRLAGLGKKFARPYTLDLSEAKEGANTFSIVEENLNIPNATRVSRISPQIIKISVEKAEKKTLRVEPNFVGSLQEGYELKSFEIFPKYVGVTGPRSRVRELKSLLTEPIPLEEQLESFEGMYSIRVSEGGIDLEERQVALKVEIHEIEVSQVLENTPILLLNAPDHVRVKPSKVALELRGPASKVKKAVDKEPSISIDLEDHLDVLKKGRTVEIKIDSPKFKGVESRIRPQSVKISLSTARR